MDKILITGCRIPVHVGITEEERAPLQEIVVDAEMQFDLSQPAQTDDLHTTIDYAVVCEQIWAIAEGKPHALIESIAGEMVEKILTEFPVQAVKIRVSKPAAIRHIGGALAAVEIERKRVV